MAIDKTARHFGHRRLAGWRKTLAIALGLMAVGYVAVTLNDDRVPPLHAFAAAAVGGADASAANPTALQGERLPTADQDSVSPNAKIDSSKTEPRECRPGPGHCHRLHFRLTWQCCENLCPERAMSEAAHARAACAGVPEGVLASPRSFLHAVLFARMAKCTVVFLRDGG